MKHRLRRGNTVRKSKLRGVKVAVMFLICGICSAVLGCRGSQTIWSTESRSPDGKMVATAQAYANGGFGISGTPETFVYLNWATGSQKAMEVLSLDNETDAPDDAVVGIRWISPTRLELTYKENRQRVSFQAVKFAAIEITLRNLADQSSNAPLSQ
jgi:hypothetical protein